MILEVFKDGYGYDEVITHPSINSLCWRDSEEFYSYLECEVFAFDFNGIPSVIPRKIFNAIGARGYDYSSLFAYSVPSDGFTDEDFLDFISHCDKNYVFLNSFRSVLTVKKNEMKDSNHRTLWMNLLDRFFSPSFNAEGEKFSDNHGRSFFIFRLIELNEFVNNANDNETLKEYLTRCYTEVSEYCKNLVFNDYGYYSKQILNSALNYTIDKDEKYYDLFTKINKEQLKKLIEKLSDFIRDYNYSYSEFNNIDYNLILFMFLNRVFEVGLDIERKEEKTLVVSDIIKTLISRKDFLDYSAKNNYIKAIPKYLYVLSSSIDTLIDMQTIRLLIKSNAFENFTIYEIKKFIQNFSEYHKPAKLKEVKNSYVYYSLKNSLISPQRFIDFFVKLEEPKGFFNKYGILKTDFFEIISNSDVPLEWALSAAGFDSEL